MSKCLIVFGLVASTQAFAGGFGGGGMMPGFGGGGMFGGTPFHVPGTLPFTVIDTRIKQVTAPPVIPPPPVVVPPPVPVVVAPPPPPQPSVSEVTSVALHGHYTTFLARTAFDQATVTTFVTDTTQILFRHSEHLTIAKSYFSGETRITFKILFASICYIATSSDPEIVTYLTQEGVTQQEFAEMDTIRVSGAAGIITSTPDPVHSVVTRFINRL